MLVINDPAYHTAVLQFAINIGKAEQLAEELAWLADYACHGEEGKTRCTLYKDWAPYSYSFTMEIRDKDSGEYKYWFNGGLIFRSPTDVWSIHT
jgi:hypothetical protein